MVANDITEKEIADLPHFGKIAFAAQCARIARDFAYPQGSPAKCPGELEERLRTAELWGWQMDECRDARRFAEQIRTRRPLAARDENTPVVAKVREVMDEPRSVTSPDPVENALAHAIHEAVQAALSTQPQSDEKDQEAAAHAHQAYGQAQRLSAFALKRADDFMQTTRDDFHALRRFIDSPEGLKYGNVPPEFFKNHDTQWYNPSAR